VSRFVAAGLVTADEANTLVARREPWSRETERETAQPTARERRAVG
jgi:hypothetical protein